MPQFLETVIFPVTFYPEQLSLPVP